MLLPAVAQTASTVPDPRAVAVSGEGLARLASESTGAAAGPAARATEVHVVEPLAGSIADRAWWERLKVLFPAARSVSLTLREPDALTGAALAAVRRWRRPRVRFNLVLDAAGGEPSRSLAFLERAAAALPGAVTAVVPLAGATVDDVFPIFYSLVRRGVPFRATLGEVDAAGLCRDAMACAFFDLAALPSTPEPLRLHYRRLSDRLASGVPDPHSEPVALLGNEAETAALRRAAGQGLIVRRLAVGLVAAARSRLARQLKLRQWRTLAGGAIELTARAVRLGRRPTGARPPRGAPRVLAVGWFGTETVGDKAILGAILGHLRKHIPALEATVASALPSYTRLTLRDLGLDDDVEVREVDHRALAVDLARYDLVLIAGGPLMDLVEMLDLVRIFRRAREAGCATLVAGCGVGPTAWPLTRWAVRAIGRASDRIVVRDRASLGALTTLGAPTVHAVAGSDPGATLLAPVPHRNDEGRPPRLGMAVRRWPRKYARQMSRAEHARLTRGLVETWARVADHFVQRYDGEVHLVPMSTFSAGDDDRWLLADVRAASLSADRVSLHHAAHSPTAVAHLIGGCDIFLAMRYHSLVFAATLGVPVIAVDYTSGGKVAAFARELCGAIPCLDLAELRLGTVVAAIDLAWEHRQEIAEALARARPELLARSSLAAEAALDLLGRQSAGG